MSKKDLTLVISASPKVRKFARELGVDIQQVKGSQREGRVIEDDIKLFLSKKLIQNKEILSNNVEKLKLE